LPLKRGAQKRKRRVIWARPASIFAFTGRGIRGEEKGKGRLTKNWL